MQTLLLMAHIVGSFVGFKLVRLLVAFRLLLKRCFGLAAERERALLGAFGIVWRHVVELDGMYRIHIALAWDGAYEVFWRHHSGEETPADVFPSLWQAVVAALLQVDRYRSAASPNECAAA